ncbi:hypothetical protein ABE10_00810, partial [Bacillus toyonensis]|nr:hypothetical protein [Bacillus toyonensis]
TWPAELAAADEPGEGRARPRRRPVELALDRMECQSVIDRKRRGPASRGGEMVTERGLQVLRAIVEDFVETNEPVG